MSKLNVKYFALFMFVILVTNLSIWNLPSKWLAHETEHRVQCLDMEIADTSSIEHQLLHAADHLQLFVTTLTDSVPLFASSVVFLPFTSIAVPHATVEAPFRPPRFYISYV